MPLAFQCCRLLRANNLGQSLRAVALGALNRGTQATVDDHLRQDTKGAGHTEENGVVIGLGQAVVLQKHTGVLYVR